MITFRMLPYEEGGVYEERCDVSCIAVVQLNRFEKQHLHNDRFLHQMFGYAPGKGTNSSHSAGEPRVSPPAPCRTAWSPVTLSRFQNLDNSACRKTAIWACVGWEHCKIIRHIRLDPGTRNKSWVWKQRPGWNALCPQLEQLTGVQADRKAKRIRNNKARRARRRRKKEEVPWRHWVGNSFFCHFQTHLAMQTDLQWPIQLWVL